MTDFLADKRQEIDSRLKELQPQVDEYRRLEAAAQVLAEIPGRTHSAAASPNGRRRPGRPRGSKAPRAAKSAPGAKTTGAAAFAPSAQPGRKAAPRRRGSGKRGAEALTLIQASPGIRIPELAAKMGIKQNYLYRVLPSLEQQGKVERKGRAWHPAAAAA